MPAQIMGLAEATKSAFLDQFPTYKTITATAAALQVHPQRIHEMLREDKEFSDAFGVAKEAVADSLEGELLRRAMAGEGQMPDTLGIFLLKGYRPMFRDSYTVTNRTITLSADLDSLPPSERLDLLRLAMDHETRTPALPQPQLIEGDATQLDG